MKTKAKKKNYNRQIKTMAYRLSQARKDKKEDSEKGKRAKRNILFIY